MQFNWLHITDLHHGMANQGWLLHGVRHRLRDDLEYLSKRCGPWDLILFTGDLTQRGTGAEFIAVDSLLDELHEEIGRLQPGRPPVLLAVPGNHDLQRPKDTDAVEALLEGWEGRGKIRERLWTGKDDSLIKTVESAFADYERWWRRQPVWLPDSGVEIHPGRMPGDFAATIEKDGCTLGVLGLDARSHPGQDTGAERLLDLLAPAVRLEPALLRALRCRLPGLDIGAEIRAWLHPDLARKVLGGEWRGGALARRFDGHRARPVAERRLAAGLLRAMHGYLLPSLRHQEGANLVRLLGGDDGGAGSYLADTLRTLEQAHGDRARRIRGHVLALAGQLPPEAWADERLVALWAAASRERLRGDPQDLPPGIEDLASVDWVLSGSAEPSERVLVQRGDALFLADRAPADGAGSGSALARLLVTEAPVELVAPGDREPAVGQASRTHRRSLPSRPDQPIPLRPTRQDLRGYDAELRIEPMTRPAWAEAIGQDADGLYVDVADGPGTRRLCWVPPGLGEARPDDLERRFRGAFWDEDDYRRWLSGETRSARWASRTGVDGAGLWAEISVEGATQRMRWIWPGEFWMGTPENEPERRDNEVQHRVMLTKGWWLADTACTQALWEAVMGENPSGLKGADRPVENVSWEDAQQLIQRLNTMAPGLDLRLPTEAEWECACRAGTGTPFSFGETIGTDQVNFDGNYPYAGGKKGEYRDETVDVKALPANDWGLYQMHGNVWEWCQDWDGDYDGDPGIDPAGPDASVGRVCRGGGWLDHAVYCRSGLR